MTTEGWALLISAISAAGSLGAILVARQSHREAVALQARLLELEESRDRSRAEDAARATLVPSIERETRAVGRTTTTTHYLRIRNDGPASARRVRIAWNDSPLHEMPQAMRVPEEIPELAPGPGVRFAIMLEYLGQGPPMISMDWIDALDRPQSLRTLLTS